MADEIEVLRMQVERLIARCDAKDAEFDAERQQLKRRIAILEREKKELRRAARVPA